MSHRPACLACGVPSEHDHHIVPKSLGGTRTIPLCVECHSKVHARRLTTSALVKEGIAKARANGVDWGAQRAHDWAVILPRLLRKPWGVNRIARHLKVHPATIYKQIKRLKIKLD